MTKREAVLVELSNREHRNNTPWADNALYQEVCRIKLIWRGMMQRCYDPTADGFANYGALGVKVAQEWHNPNTFVVDLVDTHAPDLTLDRVDVLGNYCVENCRWATAEQQARNRRNTLYILTGGGRTPLPGYAEFLGVDAYMLRSSMKRVVGGGREVDELQLLRAICQDKLRVVKPNKVVQELYGDNQARSYVHRKVEHAGQHITLRAAAKLSGVPYQTLYARHRDMESLAGELVTPPLRSLVQFVG